MCVCVCLKKTWWDKGTTKILYALTNYLTARRKKYIRGVVALFALFAMDIYTNAYIPEFFFFSPLTLIRRQFFFIFFPILFFPSQTPRARPRSLPFTVKARANFLSFSFSLCSLCGRICIFKLTRLCLLLSRMAPAPAAPTQPTAAPGVLQFYATMRSVRKHAPTLCQVIDIGYYCYYLRIAEKRMRISHKR